MKIKKLKTGDKFNRLTVIKLNHIEKKQRVSIYKKIYNRNFEYYLCKCDCGKEIIVEKNNLRYGQVKSCGCLQKEKLKLTQQKTITHYKSNTRLYHIWQFIKQRCYNKNTSNYYLYGGRGIIMCEEWQNDFISFYNWTINNGYKDDLTIDRIDVNGNYEPSNCRWVTIKEQANNKRNNIIILYKNKKYTLSQLVEETKVPRTSLYRKIKNNIL